jgi:hypothetical protein
MKNVLLGLFVLAAFAISAQPDLSVTLDAPTSGANINSGTQFTWTITITNSGNATHETPANGDSCLYAPSVDGQLLNNGGQPAIFLLADPIPAGQSVSRTLNITLTGGSSGQLEVCGLISASGTSYSVTDTASDCASVNYNAGMSVGELRIQQTFDNSYNSVDQYHVRVTSKALLVNPTIEIIDISGKAIIAETLPSDGETIEQDISIAHLPTGIYIVRLKTDKGLISINKISKQ